MRKISILILLSMVFNVLDAQIVLQKEVTTEVSEVTVFIEGAQIVRKKSLDLPKGKSAIKFVNLSPFIDAKSIQVKAEGELTVLSVHHQQNFLGKTSESKELTNLENELRGIEEDIKLESTYISIIQKELGFLQDNRAIGGRNEQVSVANLQQASDFYSAKLTELKMSEIERNKRSKT